MRNLQLSLFVIVTHLFLISQSENINIGHQSLTNITSFGLEFSSLDYQAQFLFQINVSSILSCTQHCHSNSQCRVFDYDSQSNRCRLFQGDLNSLGQIIPSSSSSSRVGSMRITSEPFISISQSCVMCVGSRYLRCVNGTCQCPVNTFYDGTICQSQKLLGQSCRNTSECRTDLNYTCLPRMKCGRK